MRPVRAHYVRLINYGMTGPDGLPVVVDVLDQPNWVAPYLKQGYSRYKKSVPPPAEASGVFSEDDPVEYERDVIGHTVPVQKETAKPKQTRKRKS